MTNNLENIYKELGEQICLFPYMAAFYGQTLPESVSPCSLSTFNSPVINNDLIQSLNQPGWIDMRKHFSVKSCHENKHCATCSQAELAGGDSPRQLNNRYFAEHIKTDIVSFVNQIKSNNYRIEKILSLDYAPSNYCNFECVMCRGSVSSTRNTFEIKIYGKPDQPIKFSGDKRFYNLLDTVEILNLCGGETLLQKEVHAVIDYLVEKDLAKNITISFLTNASKYPDKLIEKFKKFKNVFYTISIDGIDKVIEYQRRGCKWNETSQIAVQLSKEFGSVINYVVTAINVFSFIETVDWFYQHNMDRVILSLVFESNKNISVKVIPPELRQQLLDKLRANQKRYPKERFNDLISQMITILESNEFQSELLAEFRKAIAIEDTASKHKLVDVVPEWRPYFDD